jgi:general secretion pathway protein M
MNALVEWYQALSARDRKLVVVLVASLAALVIFVILVPLDRSVTRAHERLTRKQSDLTWMRSHLAELNTAGPERTTPAGSGSLIAIVSRSAAEAGLGSALGNTEASNQGGLRVRLDKAPFDTLVGWLARLEQQNGIQVVTASVDSAGAPGLVNAGIVLRAPQ